MTRTSRFAVALVATIVARPVSAAVSWVSPGPRVPPVELLDQDGTRHSLSTLIGDRPVLVSFFFTTCARLCPPQTALLREVQQQLERHGAARHPLLLSISLNPLADTPPALRAYADLFDARLGDRTGWLMLTGSTQALDPVWKAFETSGEDLDRHAATLWIGHPASHRWTRTSAVSPDVTPSRLADLLLEDEP